MKKKKQIRSQLLNDKSNQYIFISRSIYIYTHTHIHVFILI